jgi:hypothetical protein
MKKRVLKGREDKNGMPGDIVWEAVQEENPEDTAKVWIGKVSNPVVRQRIVIAFLNSISGSYHASVGILHPS